jgi:predicted ABC-class ATPase
MIRDEKMISLVAPNKEPITPFVKKVRPLLKEKGVSSILVIGGSGDYFDVADTVMMMSDYQCIDVTKPAMDIVAIHSKKKDEGSNSALSYFGNIATRYPVGEAFRFGDKVAVRSKTTVSYSDTDIDLSGLEQIVTVSQTQALAGILQKIPSLSGQNISLHDMVHILENEFQNKKLDELDEYSFNGSLEKQRIF